MEPLVVVVVVIALLWIAWGPSQDEKDAIEAHNSKWRSKLAMRDRRYTNVVKKQGVRTIEQGSGLGSGQGTGAGASKKPNLLHKPRTSKL